MVNDDLLLDLGDASFLEYKPDYVLITHLHPDHAYFVCQREQVKTNAEIFAPEKYNEVPIHVTTRAFSIGDYCIKPIPTVHSKRVKSNAYLITYKNKKILYTGDMIWIEKNIIAI